MTPFKMLRDLATRAWGDPWKFADRLVTPVLLRYHGHTWIVGASFNR